MPEPDTATARRTIDQAAADLGRARRHAIWLERLAVAIPTFAAVVGFTFALADPGWIAAALGLELVSLAAWGVLRALALLLHLRVDETMVALAGDGPG